MSIKKNYIYNLIYQVFILIIPLITIPYISRVLGSDGIGINAFTNSIIQYFILFGTVGISLYGIRAIAYVKDDKVELSRTFWGIFYLKIITTGIAFITFIIFFQMVGNYRSIFLIQSIFILAAAIDISWLYMGLEDFKKTVIRNLFVRFIGVICIFLFIKTSEDLWKYIFILAISEFLGHLTLWIYLPRTVKKIKLKWIDVKKHLMPSIYLFIPLIAIQIYVVLNKTMLGLLSNTNEVGFFDNSDKVVKMVLAIVTAMGVVMLPRVSSTFAKGDVLKVKHYLFKSFEFSSYLSFPLMFGLMGIAEGFTPWFFGPGFSKTSVIISLISPIIVFIAWSNVIGMQYLMSIGKVRAFTISVCIGAIVNFLFNIILIPYFQSAGTAIATLIAELVVIAIQLYFIRNQIEVKKLFTSTWKYLISGLLMYTCIRLIGISLFDGFITTVTQVIIGSIIYPIILIFLKSELNNKLLKTIWLTVIKIFGQRN